MTGTDTSSFFNRSFLDPDFSDLLAANNQNNTGESSTTNVDQLMERLYKLNMDLFRQRITRAQLFNIKGIANSIKKFQGNSKKDIVKQYTYKIDPKLLQSLWDNLQDKEVIIDKELYGNILRKLRDEFDVLIGIEDEHFINSEKEKSKVNVEEAEQDSDTETQVLRSLILKLVAPINDKTRPIIRPERALISKALLDYIQMKSNNNKDTSYQ